MKRLLTMLLAVLLMTTACGSEEVAKEAEPVVETPVETKESSEPEEQAPEEAKETEQEVEETPTEPVAIKVIAPYGTPALSLVQMITEEPTIGDNITVDYELIQATDVLTSELINNKADIAIVPTNLAAVLYTKEAGYKLAGSSVMGSMYIGSTEAITSLEDLKGKEVSAFGRNLTPDAVLRYVLTENGIDPDSDLTLNYFSGVSEVAADYIAGQSDIAMMAQPVLTAATIKREGTKAVIDLQTEWGKVTGQDGFPQASIIVSETLIAEAPEAVEAFLAAYDNAVVWVNENPAEAGAYYEALNLGLKAPIVQKAIPFCNLDYIALGESKETFDGYLNVLFNFNPKLTGGKAVEDGLYYMP